MAACATPGTGRPSLTTDDASPTTNTSGTPGTSREGPTDTRPARSASRPSSFTIGQATTPAVPRTEPLAILPPPATTPLTSTPSPLPPPRPPTPHSPPP